MPLDSFLPRFAVQIHHVEFVFGFVRQAQRTFQE